MVSSSWAVLAWSLGVDSLDPQAHKKQQAGADGSHMAMWDRDVHVHARACIILTAAWDALTAAAGHRRLGTMPAFLLENCTPDAVGVHRLASHSRHHAIHPYTHSLLAAHNKPTRHNTSTALNGVRVPPACICHCGACCCACRVWNANSKEVGGVIGPDWQTLDFQKLKWLQDNLGLTPWYKKAAAAAGAAAPSGAAATPAAPGAQPATPK